MEENLGSFIKKIRRKQKMTLREVAGKTDLSISFLSQLERGKSSVTLNSLKKISLALNVNPGIFFEKEGREWGAREKIVRGNEHEQFNYQDLSTDLMNPAFSPMLITLRPGENKGESFSHSGQEFLYVLAGTLTVKIEETIHVLHPKEYIMFNSNAPHYWYNYTDEAVEFICVAYDA